MRLKFDSGDQSSFRCCFCCHVRTGTLFLGLFHLVVHLFVIAALVFASIHPEVLQQQAPKCPGDNDGIIVEFDNGSGYRFETESTAFQRKMTRGDLEAPIVICLCLISVTLFLLYGLIKNRPGYLLPFFCIQVFDFCLSCLTVVGYFSYAPNIKTWIKDQGLNCFPGMEHIMKVDGQWLMLFGLLVMVLFLSLKAYLIGMVWACYRYLQMKVQNNAEIREYHVDPDTEMLLPPKYEDAIKQSAATQSANPPPAYSDL